MKTPNSHRKDQEKRQETFSQEVKGKASRKITAQREGDRTIWYGLGMFGIVGWSVAIPTLIGISIGVWLDLKLDDSYSWTLMMLFLGVVVGCLNAWYWVEKESRDE